MIKTNDSSIDWKSFKPCKDVKKVMLVENGLSTEIGTTTEQVMVSEDLLYRKQELHFNDPAKADRKVELSIKRSSFIPVSCTDQGPADITLTYDTDKLELVQSINKELKIFKITEGTFDLFSVELVLRLLPLKIGYRAELMAFNHMVGNTVQVKIDVNSNEKVHDSQRDVDAYRVQVHFGEQLQTYWISVETKELLKQSVKLGEQVYFDFVR
ncbi:hypothetical protein RCG23_03765 [Neobacillus sp. PS3-34]|uniref:hypothetical protein n=1 Tax=Neobacillus sp. PS3-34 TaxID=3070678 RepID=UPI0027E0611B|nr:hypothetical protein [Neobacillus sp. PS3-34]WML49213.1 hypothetical protein RCG23_03765 [Neobacillus sp. PS3-34]